MTTDSKETMRAIAASVIASLLVSVVGGALGMYVGFRLLDYRISQHDRSIEDLQKTDASLRALIDKNRDDRMEQIRQVTEGTMTVRAEIAGLRGFLEAKLNNRTEVK